MCFCVDPCAADLAARGLSGLEKIKEQGGTWYVARQLHRICLPALDPKGGENVKDRTHYCSRNERWKQASLFATLSACLQASSYFLSVPAVSGKA